MNDHLGKPFKREELVSILKKWLNRSDDHDGAAHRPEPTAANGKDTEAGDIVDPAISTPIRESNPELWSRLVAAYLTAAVEKRDLLTTAMADRDYGAVGMAAHTLKSSSANLGVMRLSELCRDLENAANREDADSLANTYEHVRTALDEAIAHFGSENGDGGEPPG